MGLNADKIRFAAFRARQVHELRFGEKKGRKELHLYRHLLSPYEEMLSNVISTHRLQQTHQRESDIITFDNLQALCTRTNLR